MVNNLEKLLQELNMSVYKFAKSIEISVDTIYNIVNKKYKISPYVMSKILEKYPQIRKEWLLFGDGEMFREIRIEESELVKNLKDENRILKSQLESMIQTIQDQARIIASLTVNKKNNY